MTIADFKTMVGAHVNRTVASFAESGVDILLAGMNDARRQAQRSRVFNLLRTEDAFLTTSALGADWMTGAKTTPGGATAVLMRQVDEVWNYGTSSIGATAYYPRTSMIDFATPGRFRHEMPRADALVRESDYRVNARFAYALGSKLYISNAMENTTVKLVGVKWLDDLTGAESPDIFLTYFTDWFKYATIAAMNNFLKHDQRFPVDATVTKSLWDSMVTYDGNFGQMGDVASLD